ncbi:hypothetical protein LNO81_14180 [Klebsiella variicola subsp. variicola]|nr:hypothetical protein [Klebsiella variicola subsp. variicola]
MKGHWGSKNILRFRGHEIVGILWRRLERMSPGSRSVIEQALDVWSTALFQTQS